MPTVIAYHEVKDTDHWLSSSKREEFFGPLGVTNIRTYVTRRTETAWRSPSTPPTWTPLEALQTEEGAAAMEHDGVKAETLVMLVEE